MCVCDNPMLVSKYFLQSGELGPTLSGWETRPPPSRRDASFRKLSFPGPSSCSRSSPSPPGAFKWPAAASPSGQAPCPQPASSRVSTPAGGLTPPTAHQTGLHTRCPLRGPPRCPLSRGTEHSASGTRPPPLYFRGFVGAPALHAQELGNAGHHSRLHPPPGPSLGGPVSTSLSVQAWAGPQVPRAARGSRQPPFLGTTWALHRELWGQWPRDSGGHVLSY